MSIVNQAVQALQRFQQAGTGQPVCFFSPARINLIGEHIDYCGGLVLPAAIGYGTGFAVRTNTLGRVRVISRNQPGRVEFDPNQANTRSNHWGDYVVGVFEEYRQRGADLPSLDISIAGNIPGSCLSSSASLGVGVALVIEHFLQPDEDVDRRAVARLVQHAENSFVGVNCGIMDQAAVACGLAGHAMLLDCQSLDISYIPAATGRFKLLIADTRKDRKLVTSAYNERRAEVDEALDRIQASLTVATLCELNPEDLASLPPLLSSELLMQRVRHVVTEQERVKAAAEQLKSGALLEFGRLLNASHQSLQQDYEVTGPELDTLISLIQSQAGVIGARMMGAGFGGCGIVLAEHDAIDQLQAAVTEGYTQRIGYEPAFYPVETVAGAARVNTQ